MRSFWVRIFGVFWLIDIILVTGLAMIGRRNAAFDAHMSERSIVMMEFSASESYQVGGCSQLRPLLQRFRQTYAIASYLFDENGRPLCVQSIPAAVQETASRVHSAHGADLMLFEFLNAGFEFVHPSDERAGPMAVYRPASDASPHFIFVAQTEHSQVSFGRFRTRYWGISFAIAISGIITALLAKLLVLPITRLRQTTLELASGNLKARADEGNGKSRGNEVAALLRDFNQMAERIESLVGAQRQLIRDVSHELRSPLARLSVALELMREETNSESRLHLDRMEREAERLNRLIGQLLELSRIETMAAPPKNEPVLLEEIVEKVVADAAYEASSRGCGVRALIRDNIMVKGDPELLSSAIENIVRNGIRYTRDETEVLVTLERDQTSVSAVVTVRDFGPGVPEDKLESLCLPFYRVDAARGLDTGGAGVGLAIAERVLRIHGGSLSLANHPDGGLVAAISLPASTVLSSPASLTAQSALA